MKLKVLFYSQQIAKKEKELRRWLQENQAKVRSFEVRSNMGEGSLKNRIERVLEQTKADACDCLYILETKEEWDVAQALKIAVLPYVPQGQKQPECFSAAWMVVEGFEDMDFDFLQKAYQRAHNLPWTILETERCILREFSMEDLAALVDLYAQPGVTQFLDPLYEWEQEKEYEEAYIFQMYRYYGYGMWLVCKKETGELIGRAGFAHRDDGEATELQMGYLIAPKEQQKGYATEVCRALMDYAKEKLDFPSLSCLIREGNTASVHLAEKLGFELVEQTNIAGESVLRYHKILLFQDK